MEDRIDKLKREISLLEWDLRFIEDRDVKEVKQRELRFYREELMGLSKRRSPPVC